MLINVLFIIFLILFTFLALKNLKTALIVFTLILPSYILRTNFGFFPTTLLEFAFLGIFFAWLIKYAKNDYRNILNFIKKYWLFFIVTLLFLFSALTSAFINPDYLKGLGIWRAYFLEPIILFFIIISSKNKINFKYLLFALLGTAFIISLLTIIQKLTGSFFPPSLWKEDLADRPTAFFTSPNAIGLFIVPIFLATLSFYKKINKKNILLYVMGLIILLAIFFSYSQGAWIALSFGLLIFLFLLNYRKIVFTLISFGLILLIFSNNLQQSVFFQDKAGQNRLTLWSYSINYLKKEPKNFILGTGLQKFYDKVQKPKRNKTIEPLIYPHNIFLNFWLETGLLGLISIIFIFTNLFIKLIKNNSIDKALRASFIASLVALIIHGLVDVPYFKNDLAMLFWLLIGVIFLSFKNSSHLNSKKNL